MFVIEVTNKEGLLKYAKLLFSVEKPGRMVLSDRESATLLSKEDAEKLADYYSQDKAHTYTVKKV